LPSYSPELNPDELLNANLKQHVTKAAPPRNKIVLPRTAMGAPRSIQKQLEGPKPASVKKDVAYAAQVSLFRAGLITHAQSITLQLQSQCTEYRIFELVP
jgi:predicted amino acid dehydrogenase